jgi:hypothetical protein
MDREDMVGTALGFSVEYHWVPGYSDIEGNEQADTTVERQHSALTPRQVSLASRDLNRLSRSLISIETSRKKDGLMQHSGSTRDSEIYPDTRSQKNESLTRQR